MLFSQGCNEFILLVLSHTSLSCTCIVGPMDSQIQISAYMYDHKEVILSCVWCRGYDYFITQQSMDFFAKPRGTANEIGFAALVINISTNMNNNIICAATKCQSSIILYEIEVYYS